MEARPARHAALGGTVGWRGAAGAVPDIIIMAPASRPAWGSCAAAWTSGGWRMASSGAARVAALACPKLFIHSRDDDLVPCRPGERLFAAAAEPKRFVRIRGDHRRGFLASGPASRRPLAASLREILGR